MEFLLLRDAMLARYMLTVVCLSVCLSVRPSVTRRYCIETTRRIELVLILELSLTYPKLLYKEIRVS